MVSYLLEKVNEIFIYLFMQEQMNTEYLKK